MSVTVSMTMTPKQAGALYVKAMGLEKRIKELEAERDALAAQLKHQTERAEIAEIFIEDVSIEIGAGATFAEVVDRLAQWFDADHGEKLTRVRVGVVEKCRDWVLAEHGNASASYYINEFATAIKGGGKQ